MMQKNADHTILFRVDADSGIGYGHLMRCLALAQEMRRQGKGIVFAGTGWTEHAWSRIDAEGFEVHRMDCRRAGKEDVNTTCRIAGDADASWVVLDGYAFSGKFRQTIRENGLRLLCIDDMGGQDFFAADIILNQNLHAQEGLYPNRSPDAQLLLGSRYVMLRDEFHKWRDWKRRIANPAANVLISMGGSDPYQLTQGLLKGLATVQFPMTVRVIMGEAGDGRLDVQKAARANPLPVSVRTHVSDMAEQMAWADIGITAAGTTALEMAFMQLPQVVTAIADNQIPVGKKLEMLGAAVDCGWYEDVSISKMIRQVETLLNASELRRKMSRAGSALIDGIGCRRIMAAMDPDALWLRPAHPRDCRMTWNWSNDRVVRDASFNQDPISWKDHQQWFDQRLNDSACRFYIAHLSDGSPLGQVRFNLKELDATISVSLNPAKRGKGFGIRLIEKGIRKVMEENRIQQVQALIKASNPVSIHAFRKAGFQVDGEERVQTEKAIRMIFKKKAGQYHACHH